MAYLPSFCCLEGKCALPNKHSAIINRKVWMQSLYTEVIVLQACNPTWQATVSNCTKLQLSTPWSCNVDPANPWPEYPRPQMTRPQWMNLNGQWQWQSYP